MQVSKLEVDRDQARELWRQYKTHQHYEQPIDEEIRRTYQLIAQGRMVIRALESIKQAGFIDVHDALPKLAIIRADATTCHLTMDRDGGAMFSMDVWPSVRHARRNVILPRGSFAPRTERTTARGVVPIVPIHLRPRRGLQNYHILFEAEWQRVVPKDPFLLRRMGKGDMWLVVAHWDLTEVERAALSTRLSA
jgi:hypothetical protein